MQTYICHLPPGSRFTLPGLHVAGIVLRVSESSTRVRLDRPAAVVEISDPDGGQPRSFVAKRNKETTWANTTVVQRLPNEPDDQPLESESATMTTKTKTAKKPAKAAAAKSPKAKAAAKPPKTTAVKTPKAPKAEKSERAPSLLDCAVTVLKDAGKPLTCGEMIDAILAKKLWTSTGKTPAATLYSGIIREIGEKKGDARFEKVERGTFKLAK